MFNFIKTNMELLDTVRTCSFFPCVVYFMYDEKRGKRVVDKTVLLNGNLTYLIKLDRDMRKRYTGFIKWL